MSAADRPPLPGDIAETVRLALREDVGSGDITAALVCTDQRATGRVVCREPALLCGAAWFDEVFRQVDPTVHIRWSARDGDRIRPGATVCEIEGAARSILTAERTALNFLQLLCGVATAAAAHADAVSGTSTRILDTRKTVPGLRLAQKYAVRCGGGYNHRMGLYDAVLIKENHIASCGSIRRAVDAARAANDTVKVEVEIETLEQLDEAVAAGADVVMLDNFPLDAVKAAVGRACGRVKLEVSGNVDLDSLAELAGTGVDYISVGALTKHVRAIDFSLRLDQHRSPK